MKLPLQAKPIARTPTAEHVSAHVTPSIDLCKLCALLPSPAKELCYAACG